MVRSRLPPVDARPCFAKIVFPVKLSDLTIPPEIIEQRNLRTRKTIDTITAKLRGPCGNSNVTLLRKKNGTIYFEEEGWESFLKQHSIKRYEFLVFKYNGNMSFDVNVFGVNGCLKSYDSGEATKTRKKASPASSSAPFFEVTIRGSSVSSRGIQVIPKKFQDKYLRGRNRMKMTLKNAKAVSWSVGVIPFCGKYACFSRGWKAFANGNDLKEGDVCIFKLVEENVMEVHIECVMTESDDDDT